jgi:hypothetical protein
MATVEEIIAAFESYMMEHGGNFSGWYVGVAEDARVRLFSDHGVDEKQDPWIFNTAGSRTEADRVEKYFIDQKHTKGGPGGGSEASVRVYAYRITPSTRQ